MFRADQLLTSYTHHIQATEPFKIVIHLYLAKTKDIYIHDLAATPEVMP